MIDLERLQTMWSQDSKIDIDNLHTESLNTPVLHAKYFDIYNNLKLLKKKAEQQRKNTWIQRYEYYTGKADPEVYIDQPFPRKIREKDVLQKYLDADEALSKIALKLDYYDVMIDYVQDILKAIHNRTYVIKNSLDFIKISSGMG